MKVIAPELRGGLPYKFFQSFLFFSDSSDDESDAGEEKGQADSGVEIGHDSPTGSLRLNEPSRLEELSSIDSLVSNTCKNGAINGTASTNVKDVTVDTNKDIAYMRQKLHRMGRESVHNVISRKDNLMLSPDKPHAIQEEIEKGSQDNKVHVTNYLRTVAVLRFVLY